MSEEDDSFLNVKRPVRKRMVKHSTPVDFMLSKTGLTDLTNESINDQDASKRVYGSPIPKSNISRILSQVSSVRVDAYFPHVSPKRLSTVFDSQGLNNETSQSQSSQLVFSRRRLSTVLASDESNQEPSDKVVPNTETQATTTASVEAAVTHESEPSYLLAGIPGIKDVPMAKTRKKKADKALVRKKEREWLLRQLQNIEEATKHELTIEEA